MREKVVLQPVPEPRRLLANQKAREWGWREGGMEGVESLKLVVWRWRGGERSLTPCVVYRRDKVFPREYVNYFSAPF